MAITIREDGGALLWMTPPTRITSATAEVVSPAGAVIDTPTPVLDTVDTTISSVTDEATVVVSDSTGIRPGRTYSICQDFEEVLCRVGRVDGSTITLTDPLPSTNFGTATFQGVSWSVTLSSTHTADLGTNYQVRLVGIFGESDYSDLATGDLRAVYHVVRQVFNPPMSEQRLRRLVGNKWPSYALTSDDADVIVEQVNSNVERRILATGRMPHLFGDPDSFAEVGSFAAKLALIDYGLIEPGADADAYRTSMTFELRDRLAEVVQSLTPQDLDDDGSMDDDPLDWSSVELFR